MDALEEARMDAEFEAHQDRIADDQDERDRLGFEIGDHVTVGSGKTEWVIESFSTAAADGAHLAHLQPFLGYSGTTVEVHRLRAAVARP